MKFMTMLTVPAFLVVLSALPLRSIGEPRPDDNMARMGLMALKMLRLRIQTARWRTGVWQWPISTRSTVGQPIPV